MSTRARECGVCWWTYDPEAGDDEAGIPAGVPFEELPASYTCPRCGSAKSRFVRLQGDDPALAVGERLLEVYRKIDRLMRGLPIHNARLAVELVGLRALDDGSVAGALITPWFLNVVVFGHPLPPEGETVDIALPGGTFPALGARPPGADPHLTIALLSPVDELADQAAARAFAREALRLMLDAAPDRGAERGARSDEVSSGGLGGRRPPSDRGAERGARSDEVSSGGLGGRRPPSDRGAERGARSDEVSSGGLGGRRPPSDRKTGARPAVGRRGLLAGLLGGSSERR